MSAKDKFYSNLAKDQERGLVDTKFFPGNTFDVTEEKVYAELNRMDEAEVVEIEMV